MLIDIYVCKRISDVFLIKYCIDYYNRLSGISNMFSYFKRDLTGI